MSVRGWSPIDAERYVPPFRVVSVVVWVAAGAVLRKLLSFGQHYAVDIATDPWDVLLVAMEEHRGELFPDRRREYHLHSSIRNSER